ncbi:MAG: amino acid permease [Acidobacteria bacterium]|nr:amino acid permease [Acidobacteriota bacterium]
MSGQSKQQDARLRETVLHRALGTGGAAAFVVSSMVGTGIFTVPAFVRSATGSSLAALSVWIVGASLALAGAFCYAELATRMPRAGGEYQYLTNVYGRMWGFVSGWISFFAGFAAPTAASALGVVAYSAVLFPGWDPNAPLMAGWDITQGSAIAAAITLVMAIVHCLGVRPSGRLQTILAATAIGSIVLFVLIGFASGRGNWQGITQSSPGQKDLGMWWVALIQVSFAYTGWNAAAYLAGEVKDPRRTLPRALVGGTMVVVLLYLALNLLFFYALPADAWKSEIAVGQITAEHLFGPIGAKVLSVIVSIIILGSISAWTASGPRVYFAMACDGVAPAFFHRLGKHGAPVVGTMLQAVAAAIMALSGAFGTLLTFVGSGLLLFSGFTIAAVYFARRKNITHSPDYFRVPGYPVTPAIFILMVIVSWVQSLREQPIPTGAALLTIIAGMVIYYVARAFGFLVEQPIPQPSEGNL